MKPVILVTGKNGQLGSELQELAADHPQYNFIFTDRTSLDITDAQSVLSFFSKHTIHYCINAAAYTAVDKAEAEKEIALAVNELAVINLTNACTQTGCRLIHISSDYVFDGNADKPYKEDDPVSPVNFYGLTKLKGEEAALKNLTSIVIRTSWVYSKFGNNFVKTMLRLMKDRDQLNVVSDQFGSPTNAADLARVIIKIISVFHFTPNKPGGIYHYSNEGEINWYQFAEAIKAFSKSTCQVTAIPTSAYPTPAKRPSYSVLSKEKIKQDFTLQISNWQESLRSFFI